MRIRNKSFCYVIYFRLNIPAIHCIEHTMYFQLLVVINKMRDIVCYMWNTREKREGAVKQEIRAEEEGCSSIIVVFFVFSKGCYLQKHLITFTRSFCPS